ncbi:hypothetical protein MPER_02391, partial [Moniliophthora perniciosa FA553]
EPYVYAHLQNVPEKAMQPFPDNSVIEKDPKFFFRPGARFRAKITKDFEGQIELDDCDVYLGDVAFVDTTELNMFPKPKGQDKGLRQILHGWTDVIARVLGYKLLNNLADGLHRKGIRAGNGVISSISTVNVSLRNQIAAQGPDDWNIAAGQMVKLINSAHLIPISHANLTATEQVPQVIQSLASISIVSDFGA